VELHQTSSAGSSSTVTPARLALFTFCGADARRLGQILRAGRQVELELEALDQAIAPRAQDL
jgi:hypothetical protein